MNLIRVKPLAGNGAYLALGADLERRKGFCNGSKRNRTGKTSPSPGPLPITIYLKEIIQANEVGTVFYKVCFINFQSTSPKKGNLNIQVCRVMAFDIVEKGREVCLKLLQLKHRTKTMSVNLKTRIATRLMGTRNGMRNEGHISEM